MVLPVLERPACEHHIVVYVADLPEDRIRLAAFSKRESRDPEVPPRGWSVLTTGEMPAARLDEFMALLQDRLDSPPLELQELDLEAENAPSEPDGREAAAPAGPPDGTPLEPRRA